MHKTRGLEGVNTSPYVEMDPSGRYGRFKDVLGKGAMKTVYKAFDQILGIEVAWSRVELNEVFKSPQDLQRLYCEVHLLRNLNHSSIMRFFTSWTDVDRRTFNFITEMFTSGTLREYRRKYSKVDIRAIKDWARQILQGLEYLHCHDPPVIHRDLKCDNIFVNGYLGQVKIGDLGLAAILKGSKHAHSVVGTPEFMAPELYEEEYDELVDIYSFGMCVLEMLTCEYPYSECSNPAQIYKKVTSGKLPASFYRVDDVEARRFIGRCLEKASNRPSASELLKDPFLYVEEDDGLPAALLLKASRNIKPKELHNPTMKTQMTMIGTMNREDDSIILKVQILDRDGGTRNIYFPFDITDDRPMDVATEMVKELNITDWAASEIANMIDNEISDLVPTWKKCSPLEIQNQHSFNYADEDGNDDDTLHHPFYSSSCASSQESLKNLFSPRDSHNLNENSLNWCQDEESLNYDESSQSSNCYDLYPDVKYYCPANESDLHCIRGEGKPDCIGKASICTRFGPDRDNMNKCNADGRSERSLQKLTRTESVLDLRSKLLHQKLVEEVSKLRMFKTVGAVEHIGFENPIGAFPARCSRDIGIRSLKR